MRVLHHLDDKRLERVRSGFPDATYVFVPFEGELPADVTGDVLLTRPAGCPNLAALLAGGVQWIHATGTGVDGFPFELLDDQVLTCSRGASAVPIAEWCVAQVLAAEKQLPDSWITAPPDQWFSARLGLLAGKTVGLIGFGGIAQAVARRLVPFEVEVLALRRSGQPSPIDGVTVVGDLDDVLTRSDHIVIAAPATPETRHLLDADALARLRPGAHLVNIARGDLIDQDALRMALDDGRVGLASLDTVTPEPLPEGHWLYDHPRVHLSPHISWSAPGAFDVLLDTFVANLHRWAADDPLEGVVDTTAGY